MKAGVLNFLIHFEKIWIIFYYPDHRHYELLLDLFQLYKSARFFYRPLVADYADKKLGPNRLQLPAALSLLSFDFSMLKLNEISNYRPYDKGRKLVKRSETANLNTVTNRNHRRKLDVKAFFLFQIFFFWYERGFQDWKRWKKNENHVKFLALYIDWKSIFIR